MDATRSFTSVRRPRWTARLYRSNMGADAEPPCGSTGRTSGTPGRGPATDAGLPRLRLLVRSTPTNSCTDATCAPSAPYVSPTHATSVPWGGESLQTLVVFCVV